MAIIEVEQYDWYNRPDKQEYIPMVEEILTEPAHIPTKVMIQRFKEAGELVLAQRDEWYDYNVLGIGNAPKL